MWLTGSVISGSYAVVGSEEGELIIMVPLMFLNVIVTVTGFKPLQFGV